MLKRQQTYCKKKMISCLQGVMSADNRRDLIRYKSMFVLYALYLKGELYLTKRFVSDVFYMKEYIQKKHCKVTEASELLSPPDISGFFMSSNDFDINDDPVGGWSGFFKTCCYCSYVFLRTPSGLGGSYVHSRSVMYECENLFLYKDGNRYCLLDWPAVNRFFKAENILGGDL